MLGVSESAYQAWRTRLPSKRAVADAELTEGIAARAAVLAAAYAAHPERFPRGAPKPQALPNAVWINNPARLANSQEGAQ